MLTVTVTQLRKDIYNLLDQVIESGESIQVIKNDHKIKISAETPTKKLDNLEGLPNLIAGNPDDLDKIDWSKEWKP